ncbi:MAG TPA: class I SAM-dependent methyltransferase [Dehalococcoidia bacterium]|nr:class I SAM-dependent methyltransferase [Dehalococcoidia bacterium]
MTQLQEQFDTRAPWETRFWFDGVPYGGEYDPQDDARIAMFKSMAGPLSGLRVLELGPLEGGHTLQLARLGQGGCHRRPRPNYEQCLFIKELFGLDGAQFIHGNLRDFDLPSLGPFDAIFNVGVLYHLDEP